MSNNTEEDFELVREIIFEVMAMNDAFVTHVGDAGIARPGILETLRENLNEPLRRLLTTGTPPSQDSGSTPY